MQKHLLLVGVCAGALLGASFVGVRADEVPTSRTPRPATADAAQLPQIAKMNRLLSSIRAPRSQVAGLSGITNVTLDFPSSSPKDAVVLLQSPVSFAVKGASFLGALDAVMSASGKTCRIECRRVLGMKLSFQVKDERAGDVLHSLAIAGGCSLYVLPDKLLIAAPDQLSEAEKQHARLYGVVQSAATLPPGGSWGKSVKVSGFDFNVLDVAHTKVSLSLDELSTKDALQTMEMAVQDKTNSTEYRAPLHAQGAPGELSLAFQDVEYGQAYATLAHLIGCELYLLPNKFLVCAPDGLTAEEKKVAVPIFTPSSTNPNFAPPSAPAA